MASRTKNHERLNISFKGKTEKLTGSSHKRRMERDGRGGAMNLSVSQAIATVKKFLAEEGFESVRVTSAVAIEGEAQWKVTAEIGQPATDRKEIIVNDRDGQIISYRTG